MKQSPWLLAACAMLSCQGTHLGATALARAAGVADSCNVVSVGIDTSQVNHSAEAARGEAVGETFLAVDSLIRSITIWRVAPEAYNATPMKVWITGVDSAGEPLTDRVIFSGPTITVTNGDRIHPTKIQYAFDPPRPLERGRKYFFAVQERCYGYFDVLLAGGDAYPEGEAWRTGRSSNNGCVLWPAYRLSSYDLVFTIEFCKPPPTPVRPTTWGRLKVIYR